MRVKCKEEFSTSFHRYFLLYFFPLNANADDIVPYLSCQSTFVNIEVPGGDLGQQLSVDLAVLDVLAEVLDESGAAGLGRIIIRIFRNI